MTHYFMMKITHDVHKTGKDALHLHLIIRRRHFQHMMPGLPD